MEGIERAKLKDRIAKYAIDEDKGAYLLFNLHYHLQEPTKNIDSFIAILEEMQAEKSNCFKIWTRQKTGRIMGFKVMPKAKEIYREKSFVAEYNAITEANKIMLERALRVDNIEVMTEKDLKQKTNTFLIPIIISILSVIFAGGSTLIAGGALGWSIYSSFNNVSQHQLNPTIDSIQNRLQSLENSIKKSNTPIVIDSIRTKE
jgi:hypothetical protein